MSTNLKEYVFKTKPIEITYLDKDPLKLNKDFIFFHNKIKFRKEITLLQNLIQDYTEIAPQASGIRDSYLKEEYSGAFYIVIFTTHKNIRKANDFIEPYSQIEFKTGCYYIKTTSNYMILLAKDLNGLKSGVATMEDIFHQSFKDYFDQKNPDDYVKIRSFKLLNCK